MSTFDLFSGAAPELPPRPPPTAGTLVGPYSRQVLGTRLKLWFALVPIYGNVRRYEVVFDPRKAPVVRLRHFAPGVSPGGLKFFAKQGVPDDLSPYPSTHYPRHKGDNLADAVLSLLTGDELADVTRLRIGIPPQSCTHGDEK